jgi:hypothetical protein
MDINGIAAESLIVCLDCSFAKLVEDIIVCRFVTPKASIAFTAEADAEALCALTSDWQ